MNDRRFKIIFSCTFIILGILKISNDWFQKRIDATVIAIFLISFLPWIARYLKSLEAFGVKADFAIPDNKKKKVEETIEKIENKPKNNINININENEVINDIYELSDKNTRLVLIRYEIEKQLKVLCNKNGIDSFRMSIKYLVDNLRQKKVITSDMANLILDILPILNNAVHSNNFTIYPNDFEWVNEKGIKLIVYLKLLSKEI